MADVNLSKRPTQNRQEPQARARRYDPFGLRNNFPSFWRSPFEYFRPLGSLAVSVTVAGNRCHRRLMVRTDLPGIDKSEVKVELQDGNLILAGERKREHEEESGGVRRSERS